VASLVTLLVTAKALEVKEALTVVAKEVTEVTLVAALATSVVDLVTLPEIAVPTLVVVSVVVVEEVNLVAACATTAVALVTWLAIALLQRTRTASDVASLTIWQEIVLILVLMLLQATKEVAAVVVVTATSADNLVTLPEIALNNNNKGNMCQVLLTMSA